MSAELAVQQRSPMQMIEVAFEAAIKQGSAMEVVNAILEQQKWLIQHSEEESFNEAMQRIQTKLKVVVKDSAIPGKGKYASSKAVDKAIREFCNEERIVLSFDTEKSEVPDVLCFVCDATMGPYKKRYTLPLPVDGTGAKGGGVMNKTDATLAAVTKGKRYLKNMIFNLRIEETDDEGEGPLAPELLQERSKRLSEMARCESPEKLQMLCRANVGDAFKAKDFDGIKLFDQARDKRMAELEAK